MQKLLTALTNIGYPYAHFAFVKAPDSTYIIWGEEDVEPLRAGMKQAERIIHGYVDLFTRDDSTTIVSTVETELNKIEGFSFWLNSIQFEEETGLIHYEWKWSAQ